jgi:pilus assembly protein CpaF
MSLLTMPVGGDRSGLADTRRPQYQEIKSRIHTDLLNRLNLDRLATVKREVAEPEIRSLIITMLETESKTTPLSLSEREQLITDILHELFGLGPLEELLRDPAISDILVNRADQIYVERNGLLEETKVVFKDDRHLSRIIERIVSLVGRRIDESSPMVDARLEDGSRVNAIIPPLALDGAVLSIRRFAVELLSIDDLIKLGSLTSAVAKAMAAIVKGRLNVVVSGGTGAGKTTLLNLLSDFIPASERIVTIEDSAELQLQQQHVVRLETRPPNIEGRGAVTQRDLVRNALRMRPDRIVLGEVRGGEALDMLQAMNTGHDGSLTTIHANTPRDALGRIENMVSMTGISFPVKALRSQIASAIDIVIQVERMEDGRRRVVSVQEINGMEGDVITSTELFAFERRGIDKEGNVLGELCSTGIVPSFLKDVQARGIELPIELFRRDDDALFTRR